MVVVAWMPGMEVVVEVVAVVLVLMLLAVVELPEVAVPTLITGPSRSCNLQLLRAHHKPKQNTQCKSKKVKKRSTYPSCQ